MKVGTLVSASGMGTGIIVEKDERKSTNNLLVCWLTEDLFGYPPYTKTWEDPRVLSILSDIE